MANVSFAEQHGPRFQKRNGRRDSCEKFGRTSKPSQRERLFRNGKFPRVGWKRSVSPSRKNIVCRSEMVGETAAGNSGAHPNRAKERDCSFSNLYKPFSPLTGDVREPASVQNPDIAKSNARRFCLLLNQRFAAHILKHLFRRSARASK